MMFPKPKRIRDKKAIRQACKPWCEFCGKVGFTEVHHIIAIGFAQRGHDIAPNLISLCVICHDLAQEGKISKERLVKIVAVRERKSPEEIWELIRID
ncbi:MAG: hypothetical protein DDT19_02291 [Syntrophomonadaceae bacterium]|nr:hypothetical protein [Bacillota bacterium]